MRNWAKTRLAGVVVTLTLGAVVLSACGGDSGSGGKSNADLLKEAAANMKAAKSYTLNADINQAGQAVKLNGDLDIANKNSKLDIEASGQKISVVTVGNDVYLSTDGGTTFMNAGAQGSSITSGFAGFTDMWNTFQPDQVDKVKDSLKDGSPATEKINGVDTKHITANAKDLSAMGTSAGGTATDGTVDLWISTDKPYIRQMKLNGTQDGQAVTGTLMWDKFDQPFDIKAPATSLKLNIFTAASK